MPEPRKKTKKIKKKELSLTVVPSLSGSLQTAKKPKSLDEIKNNLFNAINNAELQKSIDKWSKESEFETKVAVRDLTVLRSVITEYLDTFMLFGYNTDGERVVVQYYKSPKDKDAILEFLKTIFIQQQQNNFLD
jgi:aconitase A